MIKLILILLLIAMLVSLGAALKSLFNVQTNQSQTSMFRWLVIRVCIAFAIAVVIAIGFTTGELSIGAPWSGRY